MGKEAYLLFTGTFGMSFWGLLEHEPLIIALFIPVVSYKNWRGSWTINGSDWVSGMFRDFDLEFKQEWEHPGPVQMEGKLRQLLEESSESSGGILQKFLHRARAIPSM